MGFSFRKSKSLGGEFRLNISKTGGIGFSGGIKGLRISVNQKEARLSAGAKGVYYRKTKSLNSNSKNTEDIENIENIKNEDNKIIENSKTPDKNFQYTNCTVKQSNTVYSANVFVVNIFLIIATIFFAVTGNSILTNFAFLLSILCFVALIFCLCIDLFS